MKKILLFTAIAFCFCFAKSQTTIVLKDNSKYTGTITDSSQKKTISILVTGKKEPWQIQRDEISFIMPTDSFLQKEKRDELDLNKFQAAPSTYFKRAGGFGIASVVMMLSGTILSTVGAVKGNQIITYTGAGISGTGFILLIPTFVNLHHGGRALKNKDL